MEFYRYLPDWKENRSKPKDDPTRVVVEVGTLTVRDAARYKEFSGTDEDIPTAHKQFIDCVGFIDGLKDELTGEPITTAKGLLDSGYRIIYMDCYNAVLERSHLAAGLEKNFE